MRNIFFIIGLLIAVAWTSNLDASIIPIGILSDSELNSINYSSSKCVNNVGGHNIQTFDIPKFAPVLGELLSMDIKLSFEFFGQVHVFSPIIDQTVIVTEGDIRAYFSPQLNGDLRLLPYMRQTVPISGELTEDYVPIIYDSFKWNDQYLIESLDGSDAFDGELNEYIGTGNIPLEVWVGFNSTITSDPISVVQIGQLDIDCNLTYNYVVPEPASLLIFAVGGFVIVRRRKENRV